MVPGLDQINKSIDEETKSRQFLNWSNLRRLRENKEKNEGGELWMGQWFKEVLTLLREPEDLN